MQCRYTKAPAGLRSAHPVTKYKIDLRVGRDQAALRGVLGVHVVDFL